MGNLAEEGGWQRLFSSTVRLDRNSAAVPIVSS